MSDKSSPATDPVTFARALADETRQAIMRLCCCECRSVGEMAEELGVTQPTVSHHLAVLRRAHLVRVRRRGRHSYYTLNQDQIAVCCGKLMARYAPEAAGPEEPATPL
jgi:DNA-binding transcriptional ArsR family regulator